MKVVNRELAAPAGNDLRRVIEPLANYICAADRPRAALVSALAALFSEVRETNQAAIAHFGNVSGGR
jgi:hypothetical protein